MHDNCTKLAPIPRNMNHKDSSHVHNILDWTIGESIFIVGNGIHSTKRFTLLLFVSSVEKA